MARPSQCPACYMFELCLSPGVRGCARTGELPPPTPTPLEPADVHGNPVVDLADATCVLCGDPATGLHARYDVATCIDHYSSPIMR